MDISLEIQSKGQLGLKWPYCKSVKQQLHLTCKTIVINIECLFRIHILGRRCPKVWLLVWQQGLRWFHCCQVYRYIVVQTHKNSYLLFLKTQMWLFFCSIITITEQWPTFITIKTWAEILLGGTVWAKSLSRQD